jgi:hypothetical protein
MHTLFWLDVFPFGIHIFSKCILCSFLYVIGLESYFFADTNQLLQSFSQYSDLNESYISCTLPTHTPLLSTNFIWAYVKVGLHQSNMKKNENRFVSVSIDPPPPSHPLSPYRCKHSIILSRYALCAKNPYKCYFVTKLSLKNLVLKGLTFVSVTWL